MTFADYLQTQPLLRVSVAFAVGIVAGDHCHGKVGVWCWLVVAFMSLLLYYVLGRKRACTQSALVFLAVSSVGAALVSRTIDGLAFPFAEEPVRYEAVITDDPRVSGKTLRCDLALTSLNGKELDKPIFVKAAILRDTVAGDWRALRMGSGLEAWSQMRRLENYVDGGNFDYVRWLQVRGFRARTFVFCSDWMPKRVSMRSLSRADRLRLRALQVRKMLVGKTEAVSRGDGQRQAVIAAMTLGDKHALSRYTKDVYSVTGASHVLALSGLHLGIIYAMLTLLFGRWRRAWLTQALTLVAVWTYVVVVGMGASVVRSALMLTIYSLAVVARRDRAQVNSLSFAALCLLAVNPLCLWDIGFQMSFLSVLAILIYYRPVYDALRLRGKLAKALWGMTVVSLSAQVGAAPLVAYYFGRFPCYFLLVNFVVVPAATVIIYGTVALFLTVPVPTLSLFLSRCLGAVAGWLNDVLAFIAQLPGASIDGIHVNALQVCLVYAIMAALSVAVVYAGKASKVGKMLRHPGRFPKKTL